MKSANTTIHELLDQFATDVKASPHWNVSVGVRSSVEVDKLETALIQAFAWQPIEDADLYGLRNVPPGKNWGPRVIVCMNGAPAIAYWDPDQVQPDGSPVASPSPYWRAIQKTAGWSRKARVTHFLRPYSPHV